MTSGELARMINGSGMIEHPCLLYVVPMLGWKRSMVWKDTGLKWRPTSPLVPHAHSPLYQVAMGMVGEIGGVDLGFGTSRPFEVVGASWLEAEKVARRLNDYQLTGVRFSAIKSVVGRGSQKGADTPCSESGHHRCILGSIDPRQSLRHRGHSIGPRQGHDADPDQSWEKMGPL